MGMGVLQPLKYILKKKSISSVTPAGVKGVERIERQQQVHLWHCSLESQRACFRCTVMIVFLAQFSYFLHQDCCTQVEVDLQVVEEVTDMSVVGEYTHWCIVVVFVAQLL